MIQAPISHGSLIVVSCDDVAHARSSYSFCYGVRAVPKAANPLKKICLLKLSCGSLPKAEHGSYKYGYKQGNYTYNLYIHIIEEDL